MPSRSPLSFYLGSGETLSRVERYTRVGPDTIEYASMTDDPGLYGTPYTVLCPLVRDDSYMMLQSGCHEHNYGMPNILSAARANQAGALQAAREEAGRRQPQLQAMKQETEAWVKSKVDTNR